MVSHQYRSDASFSDCLLLLISLLRWGGGCLNKFHTIESYCELCHQVWPHWVLSLGGPLWWLHYFWRIQSQTQCYLPCCQISSSLEKSRRVTANLQDSVAINSWLSFVREPLIFQHWGGSTFLMGLKHRDLFCTDLFLTMPGESALDVVGTHILVPRHSLLLCLCCVDHFPVCCSYWGVLPVHAKGRKWGLPT